MRSLFEDGDLPTSFGQEFGQFETHEPTTQNDHVFADRHPTLRQGSNTSRRPEQPEATSGSDHDSGCQAEIGAPVLAGDQGAQLIAGSHVRQIGTGNRRNTTLGSGGDDHDVGPQCADRRQVGRCVQSDVDSEAIDLVRQPANQLLVRGSGELGEPDGSAEPVALFEQGDVCAAFGRYSCRFHSGRPTTDDHDSAG